jgi:hypothetical protein
MAINPENFDSSAQAKGARLREARKLTFLGLAAFAQKYGFNSGTLKSWEHGLHGGLPTKRANEITIALQKEGIMCTVEWLMHGIGIAPTQLSAAGSLKEEFSLSGTKDHENVQIQEELALFCQHCQDPVYFIVEDDAICPQYNIGDIVAGVKKYAKEMRSIVNLDCILQIFGETKPIFRTVCQGTQKDLYTLICKNPDTTTKPAVNYDVKLIWAAPIIWFRRKNI